MIGLKEFAKKFLGVELQPYQERLMDLIEENSGKTLIYDPRRRFIAEKECVKSYFQSKCDHEWIGNVLLITPESKRIVTACLKCEKVSNNICPIHNLTLTADLNCHQCNKNYDGELDEDSK